jgi:hypothetical protein
MHWRMKAASHPRDRYTHRYASERVYLREAETPEAARQAAIAEKEARDRWVQSAVKALGWHWEACSEEAFVRALDHYDQQIARAEDALEAKRAQWESLWQSLQALDQLFIAV